MAKSGDRKLQEQVLEILLGVPETENTSVHEDMVEIANLLPIDLAEKCVPAMIGFVGPPYPSLLPRKLGAFAATLARGGRVEAALAIVETLFGSDPDPRSSSEEKKEDILFAPRPVPKVRDWDLGEIREKFLPDVVEAGGVRALHVLIGLLDRALQLSRKADEGTNREDYSYIWRPTITEDRDETDLTNQLVSAVRDAAESIVRSSTDLLEDVVTELAAPKFQVLERIALYVLRIPGRGSSALLTTWVDDEARFQDHGLRVEYDLLLESRFGELPEETQKQLLAWMVNPEGEEGWRARFEEVTKTPPTPEEVERWRRSAILDRLRPVRALLPEEWRSRYQEYVEDAGEPRSSAERRGVRTWVGPTSPRTADDLRAMSVEGIVGYLKSWEPSGRPMEPSPEGLGRALSETVEADPARFAQEAERFEGMDPTYVRSLVQGLEMAVRAKRDFPWEPVIRLLLWIVEQPRDHADRKDREYFDLDPGWGWTRRAIASLLDDGLSQTHGAIPLGCAAQIWAILQVLCADPDPTPEHEIRFGGSNSDPATLAINSTRSEALSAVIRFARWLQSATTPEGGGGEMSVPVAWGEIRELLERHLDTSIDPSLAVRSVYGRAFPQLIGLDEGWASGIASAVFPLPEADRKYWDASWESFLAFNHPHRRLLEVLHRQYEHAVSILGTVDESVRHIQDPEERLGEHLAALYLWGALGPPPAGLFGKFLSEAPGEARRHALAFLGRGLRDAPGSFDQDMQERLRTLWEWRLSVEPTAEDDAGDREIELGAFAEWFVSRRFDDDWSYRTLVESLKEGALIEFAHPVVERLAADSEARPADTLSCLELLLESEKDAWLAIGSEEPIRAIINGVKRSGDQDLVKRANELVSRLIARGHRKYRDLIQE
jgi:hypothetical protein